MSPQNCPDRQALIDFSLGLDSQEHAEQIAVHLAVCADCQTLIEKLEQSDTFNELVRIRPNSRLPQCDAAIERVIALGVDLSGTAESEVVQSSLVDPVESLGSIRDYRLLEKLGQGGMGAVYKALHVRLRKVVAIKVLPPHRLSDAAAVARFDREMQAVGALDHPHIVRALDAGEDGGRHYLVMEYVEGADLSVVSRRHGPLPIADACELIRQAALGLHYAHEHGLVHRDIKPSNLMLARQAPGAAPIVKILDLGLARLQNTAAPEPELTSSGQMMGTADYVAPEQAAGRPNVDHRADIYSLGCTLYRLLCGRALFSGPQYETVIQKVLAHTNEAPPELSEQRADIPVELAALVRSMLAKSPQDRPTSTADVAAALAPFAESANLLRLASDGAPANVEAASRPSASTGPELASSFAVTKSTLPRGAVVAPTAVKTPPRFRRPYLVALAAAGGIALLWGITLLIRHPDGTQTEMKLPTGTQVTLKENSGNDPAPASSLADNHSELPKETSVVGRKPVEMPKATTSTPATTQQPVQSTATSTLARPAESPFALRFHFGFEEGGGEQTTNLVAPQGKNTLRNIDPVKSWTTDVPPSPYAGKYALQLDGVDDWIDLGNAPEESQVTVSGTFCAWMKFGETSVGMLFGVQAAKPGNAGWLMSFYGPNAESNPSTIKFYVRDEHINRLEGFADVKPLYDGQWHHVGIHWRVFNNKYQVYLDGKPVSVKRVLVQGPTVFQPMSRPIRLGASSYDEWPNTFLRATLDDVRWYARELTGAEIQTLAERTRPPATLDNILDQTKPAESTEPKFPKPLR